MPLEVEFGSAVSSAYAICRSNLVLDFYSYSYSYSKSPTPTPTRRLLPERVWETERVLQATLLLLLLSLMLLLVLLLVLLLLLLLLLQLLLQVRRMGIYWCGASVGDTWCVLAFGVSCAELLQLEKGDGPFKVQMFTSFQPLEGATRRLGMESAFQHFFLLIFII